MGDSVRIRSVPVEEAKKEQGLQIGDKVKVRQVSLDEARALQEGHGGWGDDMASMLGESGVIESIDSDGDVRLLGKTWNPEFLEREPTPRLQVGDCVVLAPGFERHGDAASGILKPGDVGVLEQDDRDSKPFKVRFKGQACYYTEPALCRAPEGQRPETDAESLPQLSEADRETLAPEQKLLFKKSSSYAYPASCADGQLVTYLQSNTGSPPCQIRWPSGFTYWVEFTDLRRLTMSRVGSVVRIRPVALADARELQANHGEWDDGRAPLLGCMAKIELEAPNGDLQLFGKLWNPAIVEDVSTVVFKVGGSVSMLVDDSRVEEFAWADVPGNRLFFDEKETFTVAEIDGNYFMPKEYRGFWAPMGAAALTVSPQQSSHTDS